MDKVDFLVNYNYSSRIMCGYYRGLYAYLLYRKSGLLFLIDDDNLDNPSALRRSRHHHGLVPLGPQLEGAGPPGVLQAPAGSVVRDWGACSPGTDMSSLSGGDLYRLRTVPLPMLKMLKCH